MKEKKLLAIGMSLSKKYFVPVLMYKTIRIPGFFFY